MKLNRYLTTVILVLIIVGMVILIGFPEYCGRWSARYDCGYNKIIIKLNNIKYK